MKKTITGLTLFIFIMAMSVAFGLTYPAVTVWNLQNNTYLSFDQSTDFYYAPQNGLLTDHSLVAYWNMNNNNHSVIFDSSGNDNNGNASNTENITGRYGLALNFSGVNASVSVKSSSSLQITKSITISAWIKINSLGTYQTIIDKSYGSPRNGYYLAFASNRLLLGVWNDGVQKYVYGSRTWNNTDVDVWHHVVGVFDGQTTKLYVDGIADGTTNWASFMMGVNSVNLLIGHSFSNYFSGSIDEVRIYNRTLTSSEITSLYIQPDSSSLITYFNYKDSSTNNTLLIQINNSSTDANNSVMVNCTNFFVNNQLHFMSNTTATLNIWTNLGKPIFTTGSWNSENFTTTLVLHTNSNGQLSWNGTAPYSSNLSTATSYAGNITTFSAFWTDRQGLSNGGYILSTNNTGVWRNSSWNAFTSSPDWGNFTLTLNSTVGVTVSFREYANNTLGIWGNSSDYMVKTTILTTGTSSSTPTHSPSVTATATPTVLPTKNPNTPTKTPDAVSTPTSPPSYSPQTTSVLTTESILIVTGAVAAVLFVLLTLAYRKGILKVDVVTYENLEP